MQKGLSLISRSPRPINDHMIITNTVDNQVRLSASQNQGLGVIQCGSVSSLLMPWVLLPCQRAVVELRDFAEAVPAQERQTGSAT